MKQLPLAITVGEPAGIGPDIVVQLLQKLLPTPVIVIGDPRHLQQRAAQLSLPLTVRSWDGSSAMAHEPGVAVMQEVLLTGTVIPGQLNPAHVPYVLNMLRQASDLCLAKKVKGVITGPVHKAVINEAGMAFSGQTEFFAEQCGVIKPIMMLANEHLRVVLVTTHLPLAQVPRHVTHDAIKTTIEVTAHALQQQFGIREPRLLVCGLNPHAGEQGYLGREEIDIINPCLRQLREQGLHLSDALPADTAFTPEHLATADAVVAMYHDQGLPVIKSQGFGDTVNITLGLPILRVSVDHGTALHLAGTGQARVDSLWAAYQQLQRMQVPTTAAIAGDSA